MKIKTRVPLFYDEGYEGLVVGKDDWGENDRCWLYLPKGTVGEGEDIDDEFLFENNVCTTVDPDWVDIISE